MSDKIRKLEDIKRDGKEQARRAEQMKDDAQRHKKEVEILEQSSATLKEGLGELQSDDAAGAMRSLEKAKDAAKREIDRIKEERDRLLAENATMSEKVAGAKQRSQKVGHQMALIRGAAQGDVARLIDQGIASLKNEWNNLNQADAMLSEAQLKLKLLKTD